MTNFTYGSLFSGIGGIDLGLDRVGFHCEWQVEIDEYCQKILAKHWPNVARFRDVRDCGKHNLTSVDLIAGGFPCQDISIAGKRAGITGERSGLWKEFYRVICELRPRFVLVENVAALLYGGIDTVLADLAACGYDAEWQVLSAEALGAPHLRERVFIVGYSASRRETTVQQPGQLYSTESSSEDVAHTQSTKCQWSRDTWSGRDGFTNSSEDVSNANRSRLAFRQIFGRDTAKELATFTRDCSTGTGQWAVEPAICRVAHGIPHRVDRLRGLGNAVVPQCAEFVGRCIMAAMHAESEVVA